MVDINPVRAYIQRQFMYDEGAQLAEDDTLFPSIVDSLGIVELVDFLEENYGVDIGEEDLVVTNFSTLGAIASLIESKQRS